MLQAKEAGGALFGIGTSSCFLFFIYLISRNQFKKLRNNENFTRKNTKHELLVGFYFTKKYYTV